MDDADCEIATERHRFCPLLITIQRVTDAVTSARMAHVRSRDTAPELALRAALWAEGLRGWRCHPKRVPGRPDLAWVGRRVAVFVDGAFWHGHPKAYWGQSGRYWDEKIDRNRARDERVNRELADAGWSVVRLWDFEVEQEPRGCAERVRRALSRQAAGAPVFMRTP